MRVCLFEDRFANQFEPLTQTRPVFSLLIGQTSLAAKQYRHFRARARAALVRPYLADLTVQLNPTTAVNDSEWLAEAPCVLVNARWLPPAGDAPSEPGIAMVGDEIAYVVLHEAPQNLTRENLEERFSEWGKALPRREVGGRMFHHLWEMVDHNADQILRDWEQSAPARPGSEAVTPTIVGPRERLVQAPSARIDPMVVADTTMGPVILDRDVVVKPFTRLEGPCYIGRGTHLVGSNIRAGTTLGPQCRMGGEVECSIVQGFSNKYHDGFLGHSYVGEWVNLAAGTQTSDLRHDYGEICVVVQNERTPTGLSKVGCFLGDHIKTGLTTFLNTGANVGTFCNLFPTGGYCPKYMPSFTDWKIGELVEQQEIDTLLKTASMVMARRGVNLTEVHKQLYQSLFRATASDRRKHLDERLAKSARRAA